MINWKGDGFRTVKQEETIKIWQRLPSVVRNHNENEKQTKLDQPTWNDLQSTNKSKQAIDKKEVTFQVLTLYEWWETVNARMPETEKKTRKCKQKTSGKCVRVHHLEIPSRNGRARGRNSIKRKVCERNWTSLNENRNDKRDKCRVNKTKKKRKIKSERNEWQSELIKWGFNSN